MFELMTPVFGLGLCLGLCGANATHRAYRLALIQGALAAVNAAVLIAWWANHG